MTKLLRFIWVANRGEIALRVIRACQQLGLRTLAIYSTVDAQAPYVLAADESQHIGDPASAASSAFLDFNELIAMALRRGCDAVHPGYGFLSENALFVEACERAGLTFVGPSSQCMRQLGSKIEAKRFVREHLDESVVRVVPGYDGEAQDTASLVDAVQRCGLPALLKASAGGGGRGMRVVERGTSSQQIAEAVDSARREAEASFGDGRLLVERYIERSRHVEVQVFGDLHGSVVHLFERECTVQRRHQKLIEEAPCVALSALTRQRICEAGAAIARQLAYAGAGTVEFIVDADNLDDFFFLEVNTRIQVEHPVTECITGLDLVVSQLRVAQGASLDDLGLWPQSRVRARGHAIECRLNAEDPLDFAPQTGTVLHWRPATSTSQFCGPYPRSAQGLAPVPIIRCDTGIVSGSLITVYYDSLIAKLIVFAESRETAILLLLQTLRETELLGLRSNLEFFLHTLAHPVFAEPGAPRLNTSFVQLFNEPGLYAPSRADLHALVTLCALDQWCRQDAHRLALSTLPSAFGSREPDRRMYNVAGKRIHVRLRALSNDRNGPAAPVAGNIFMIEIRILEDKEKLFSWNDNTGGEGYERFGGGVVRLFGWSAEPASGNVHRLDVALGDDRRLRAIVASYPRSALADVQSMGEEFHVHCAQCHSATSTIVQERHRFDRESSENTDAMNKLLFKAPMTGKVVNMAVQPGQDVNPGDLLFVLESMKMETKYKSNVTATVEKIASKDGDIVKKNQLILKLKER